MADLTETPIWPAGIFQLENTDPVMAGVPNRATRVGGPNIGLQETANRTSFLKSLISGAHRTVQAISNDPPGVPVAGVVWVIGDTPTGAWAGRDGEVAIWSGDAWLITAPPNGMTITDAAGDDWRWNQTGGVWLPWQATDARPGPVRLATATEALHGEANDLAVTPATLAAAMGLSSAGLPLYLELSNAGETDQVVPEDVYTRCENMVVKGGNAGTLWDGARFTVDASSLGVYGVVNAINLAGETSEQGQTRKNGTTIADYFMGSTTGGGNVVTLTNFALMTTPGDYIEFYHRHASGEAKINSGSRAQFYRLLPYTPPA
ncbi:DUF2793 domain-containing protein [Pukyongiella litopenaei]|uniref:DUF2793 domain-containing protein n=1 Tax=Pukyongiella litopenaei TaxID=2605946 RepID=A0A2S0MNU8_9RHOB|nr:DUF2793 domain-containing protein [Pukyongiella litopenaei]AVO37393.1 DUF2793 domain-containing protein [Pukyongiella litopenaei]